MVRESLQKALSVALISMAAIIFLDGLRKLPFYASAKWYVLVIAAVVLILIENRFMVGK